MTYKVAFFFFSNVVLYNYTTCVVRTNQLDNLVISLRFHFVLRNTKRIRIYRNIVTLIQMQTWMSFKSFSGNYVNLMCLDCNCICITMSYHDGHEVISRRGRAPIFKFFISCSYLRHGQGNCVGGVNITADKTR